MDISKIPFGHNLMKARNEKGLSQTALAEKVFEDGKKQSQISKYENGEAAPNLETAVKIARALGVSLDSLCGMIEQEQKQELSPVQWLWYLDQLLDSYFIKLEYIENDDNPRKNHFCIGFYLDEMNKFFKSYNAMRVLKKDFSREDYQNIAMNLFSRYEYAFSIVKDDIFKEARHLSDTSLL